MYTFVKGQKKRFLLADFGRAWLGCCGVLVCTWLHFDFSFQPVFLHCIFVSNTSQCVVSVYLVLIAHFLPIDMTKHQTKPLTFTLADSWDGHLKIPRPLYVWPRKHIPYTWRTLRSETGYFFVHLLIIIKRQKFLYPFIICKYFFNGVTFRSVIQLKGFESCCYLMT